jgi:hypothetical protein
VEKWRRGNVEKKRPGAVSSDVTGNPMETFVISPGANSRTIDLLPFSASALLCPCLRLQARPSHASAAPLIVEPPSGA